MAAPVRRFIKSAQLQAPRLICHPGGAKVLDAIEVALDLQKGTLRDERDVLRNYGNMSAPTVLVRSRASAAARFARSGHAVGTRARIYRKPARARGCAWVRERGSSRSCRAKARRTCFRAVQYRAFARQGCRRVRCRALSTHNPLHASWLIGLWVFGHDRPIVCSWFAVFVLLQFGRLWVIASLGQRWTTRVIVLRAAAPVTRGPIAGSGIRTT